ncbi:DHH family phosphoesterase [Natronobiforma cellulositropha]|uniref:DHH family phosphoesterase n=1 Tax=Natronobiforma cellulositropha TaxID=1679076 RepID=UPI0021D5F106|nr:phosphohydrolase [Natronobiforma cellulositropha]
MYEDLVSADLSIARKSVLPGTGFFLPDDRDDDAADERAKAELEGAEAAVVADPDADGLACVALIRETYDDVRVVPDASAVDSDAEDASEDEPSPHRVVLLPAAPHEIEDGLERVADYAPEGIDLFVCDLAPDRFGYVASELAAASEVASSVRWFDHHQWDEDVAHSVRSAGVDLVVGDSDEECTADVVYRSLETEFDPLYEELAAVTRDHDLWLREDPRSDDLADFAYWSAPAVYVETVREYGADLPEWAEAYLTERRVEKEALIEQALGRTEMREIGGYTVGITYGRCSQNEVAEAMREQGADASVIVKPAGSASIRGTDAFQRCHEVAGRLGGGGHPKAAGCKPDVLHDVLDYAYHWTTRGAVTRQVILEAFAAVCEEHEDSAETA